ncbi:transmembrane protein 69-like [Tubulanus polymorphus]|uniref:transmembrane protein 69-like n=1 Tax=Tubulanus polymorphus TaxID=672921 RepID=UPI003DA64735
MMIVRRPALLLLQHYPFWAARQFSWYSTSYNLTKINGSYSKIFNQADDNRSKFSVYTGMTSKLIHTTPTKQIEEDHKTKALTIFKDLHKVRHSPLPALTLGLSGLIPFVAVPGCMIFMQTYCPELAFAQVAYGASILSFLGGVRWGLTLHTGGQIQPNWHNLGYSVMPSLVAWTGLMLPHTFSALTLIGGLGMVAYFDTVMRGYPDWFKALRFILSFFAVLSLWTTLICKYILGAKKSAQTAPPGLANTELTDS